MLHSDYPLQALLYVVVVHRYLRWRQPGYDPAQHLGGVLYLYLRGMCGPETPEDDGHPAGVFSWQPPVALVTRCPTCSTATSPMTPADTASSTDPHDLRLVAGRRRAAARRSTTRACSTRPTCTSRRVADALATDDDDRWSPWPWPSWCARCAAARSASTWPRPPTRARRRAALARRRGVARRRRGQRAAHRPQPGPAAARPRRRAVLYLDRYWREEEQVHADLVGRPASLGRARRGLAGGGTRPGLPGRGLRRAAAPRPRVALTHATTVLTGGPGTGKTTTVAGLLALCADQAELDGRPALRIALAAPTGKAAARLQEAVEEEVAELPRSPTGARLAGVRGRDPAPAARWRPDTSHPVPPRPRQPAAARRGRGRRDLDGLADDDGPAARGGPAAAAGWSWSATRTSSPRSRPARCSPTWSRRRTGADPGRRRRAAYLTPLRRVDRPLAEARARRRRRRRARAARGRRRPGRVRRRRRSRAADPGAASRRTPSDVLRAAEAGDADRALELLDEQRLLCAHREGPYGVRRWNAQVERWLGEETGEPIYAEWYVGRPLLVTANDYGLGIYNGDTGVAVRPPAAGRPRLRAAIAGSSGRLDLATSRLDAGRDHARD